MNRDEIIQFITENNINKDSFLIFTIIEHGHQIEYKGRFEFNNNRALAISEDKVGIRIQIIKDASDMPYAGGLLIENLINVRINE